jgi:hypothetical protein
MLSAQKRCRSLSLSLVALGLVALGASHRPAVGQTAAITLAWTAPGDDGTAGRASRYDLRYSRNAITGTDTTGWWYAATTANMTGRVPATSGTTESVSISGLTPGVRYYAILRAADEVPNWSRFSNVVSFVLTDKLPPRQIVDLSAH